MSKTSQCIELLKILYSRSRIVSVNELSDVLETNPRNIPEYVSELRDCGYDKLFTVDTVVISLKDTVRFRY